jgi:hypothetical protein
MGLALANVMLIVAHLAMVRSAWRRYRPLPGQRRVFFNTLCFGPTAVELAYGFPIRGGTRAQRTDLALWIAAKGGLYVERATAAHIQPDGLPSWMPRR